ncbi:MAG TPA: ChbG/HpnK family deacetylase [Gemmataceae bacterium]|nr:ChbG/HpnK family deacetylase [Gemmataceae bacterium]
MNATSLIVRADGFGLCHAANQAVAEAFETGILTCASLMVTTPWMAEAVRLAHEYSEWEIGLQLTLASPSDGYRWGPVCGAGTVPSLVEPAGTFPVVLVDRAQPEEIARELNAQVERMQACGLRPAYLVWDGPDHPGVTAAVQQLSERFGIPAWTTAWGVAPLTMPEPTVLALESSLTNLKPGNYLWRTCPVQVSPETGAIWTDPAIAANRYAESLTLCDPEVVGLLDKHGIERISFRQFLEERLGTETEE